MFAYSTGGGGGEMGLIRNNRAYLVKSVGEKRLFRNLLAAVRGRNNYCHDSETRRRNGRETERTAARTCAGTSGVRDVRTTDG
jgi:hypothetical protein